MQCVEWEALLADALDGALHGSTLAGFEAHQQSCPVCGVQYREAAAGMHWLKGLEEVEVPRNLVHNIMVQTVGALPEAAREGGAGGRELVGTAEGPHLSGICSGGDAALCHVVRHGVLLHHHAAERCRLPRRRFEARGSERQRACRRRTTPRKRGWCVITKTSAWFMKSSLAYAICAAPPDPKRSRRNQHAKEP